MAQSESHKAAVRKYNDRNYDRIAVVVRRGDREKLKTAAESAGMSINAFVLSGRAVEVLDWLRSLDEPGS